MDSTIWWIIALGILVLGLVIAGVGVFLFIKGMKEPMKKIKSSGEGLKERFDKLNLEVSSLQHTATELSEEMAVKSEKIGVLVDAGKGTMNSLIDLNASVRAITDRLVYRAEHDRDTNRQVKQVTDTAEDIIHLPENLQTLRPNVEKENAEMLHFEEVR